VDYLSEEASLVVGPDVFIRDEFYWLLHVYNITATFMYCISENFRVLFARMHLTISSSVYDSVALEARLQDS
jgi:hypothetical protein